MSLSNKKMLINMTRCFVTEAIPTGKTLSVSRKITKTISDSPPRAEGIY